MKSIKTKAGAKISYRMSNRKTENHLGGCSSSVSKRHFQSMFPFDCVTVAGSGKVGFVNRLITPVVWLLTSRPTVLSGSAVVVEYL